MLTSTAGAQVQNWEYARLADAYVYQVERFAVNWSAGGEITFGGSNFTELYNWFREKNTTLPALQILSGDLDEMDILNIVGAEGWELIQVIETQKPGLTYTRAWYFKRPLK